MLLAWENEAYLAIQELGKDRLEILYPSLSILAEPPVALIDKVVDKRGTRALAQAYLEFLYSPAAQAIIAKNHYRSRSAIKQSLPPIRLFTIDEVFGGWAKAQKVHFDDGALFDQIYQAQ